MDKVLHRVVKKGFIEGHHGENKYENYVLNVTVLVAETPPFMSMRMNILVSVFDFLFELLGVIYDIVHLISEHVL